MSLGNRKKAQIRKCQVCGFYRASNTFGAAKNYYEGNTSKSTCNPCFDQLLLGEIPEYDVSKYTSKISEQQLQILTLSNELHATRKQITTGGSLINDQLRTANAQIVSLKSMLGANRAELANLKIDYAKKNIELMTERMAVESLRSNSDLVLMKTELEAAKAEIAHIRADASSQLSVMQQTYDQLNADYIYAVEYSRNLEIARDNQNPDLIVDKYLM